MKNGGSESLQNRSMRVFVLLFNARTENEGIHSVRIGDRETVLMFASEDDATRFGLMLEAQDFPLPSVEAMEEEEIEEFCSSAGYGVKLIPEGALAVPPEKNLGETTWQADAKPSNRTMDPGSKAPDALEAESESTMSEAEMDRIRRQLEKLL